jgi:hypothetical protein
LAKESAWHFDWHHVTLCVLIEEADMLVHRFLTTLAAAVAIFCARQDTCRAGFTFLGPAPYLSAADSPFPVDGSNANFYLEDFEDGELDTPGIFQPLHPITHASVIQPHGLTDSVDADDGLIDGVGNDGHSLAANAYLVFPIDPPRSWSHIRFGFDPILLGFYPNSFGFVWTDGIASNDVLIELFDDDWELLASNKFVGLGDDFLSGQTAEDRFIGVISSIPFAYVQITSMYSGSPYTFEIDHVQYGWIEVPEPRAASLVLAAFMILSHQLFIRVRHRFGRSALAFQSIDTWRLDYETSKPKCARSNTSF